MDDTPTKLEHKAQVLFSDPYLVRHDKENSSDFTHMPRDATIGKTGKITVLPKGRFFQKVWCMFLIAQKMCRKLSWKWYFEIVLGLESADSNCTARGRENSKYKA